GPIGHHHPARGETNYIEVRPVQGPAGTQVKVRGYVARGTCPNNPNVTLVFVDANKVYFGLGSVPGGNIRFVGNIPDGAVLGAGSVFAEPMVYDPRFRRCHIFVAVSTRFY